MSIVREGVVASAEATIPRGAFLRVQFRNSVDHWLTVGIAVVAIVLVVGFQVLGRMGPDKTEGPR